MGEIDKIFGIISIFSGKFLWDMLTAFLRIYWSFIWEIEWQEFSELWLVFEKRI